MLLLLACVGQEGVGTGGSNSGAPSPPQGSPVSSLTHGENAPLYTADLTKAPRLKIQVRHFSKKKKKIEGKNKKKQTKQCLRCFGYHEN